MDREKPTKATESTASRESLIRADIMRNIMNFNLNFNWDVFLRVSSSRIASAEKSFYNQESRYFQTINAIFKKSHPKTPHKPTQTQKYIAEVSGWSRS